MEDKKMVTAITSQGEDFSQWFIDVIRKAELADYAPVRGCMVIRPYGFRIWENIHNLLDTRIKRDAGCQNAYFPLFIPQSFLEKEAEHVEGFAPEVAWVTHGGGEELEERLAIRPTSEAIICSMYSKWISSYRDLPLLINQWANVVRWEKVTRPFLRTTEFLWQEGHTVHTSQKEAEEYTLLALQMYKDFFWDDLAMPVICGLKTEREKFAGALRTYAVEMMMPDGRALQAGTSHNLGQHFAKVFDIKYLDEKQKEVYAWQTSWGVSSRIIGALIMVHGDDNGLMFPPRVAPLHAVVVPIIFDATKEKVLAESRRLAEELNAMGIICQVDDREEQTAGWKFAEWELRGVPLRLELGPKDLEKGTVCVVRRDNRAKEFVPRERVVNYIEDFLTVFQKDLLHRAIDRQKALTRVVEDYEEFKRLMEDRPGFLVSGWCGDDACEGKVQEETGATVRVIPLEKVEGPKKCLCGKKAKKVAYYAKAY